MLCCKEAGLTLDELRYVTVGGALDFQTDYVALHTQHEESHSRKATQADFDRF